MIVGIPARIVRRNIAWERPHLSLTKPYYKPDASTVQKSASWNLTIEDEVPTLIEPVTAAKKSLAERFFARLGYEPTPHRN